jgi:hypothetical protein
MTADNDMPAERRFFERPVSQFVWYSSSDYEDPERYCLELMPTENLHRPLEQRSIAERCADDFYHNYDGWESLWPRDVTLYESEDGPPLASFEVECEVVTEFCARRKEIAA